jgi:hypothetical protein
VPNGSIVDVTPMRFLSRSRCSSAKATAAGIVYYEAMVVGVREL